MSDKKLNSGAICGPAADHIWIKRYMCPTCGKKRFFACWHVAWYGVTLVCLKCGERFDGEEGRMERPFMRGWRKDSKSKAKKYYRRLMKDETVHVGI